MMSTREFVLQPLNVIDLLAILPFFIELFLKYFGPEELTDLRFLRVLRLFRILRLMKIGKYSVEIQVLARAVGQSWEAVVLLVALLMSSMIIFGTAMYSVERGKWSPELGCYVGADEAKCSPFESIPLSFYWGVTTMTTVGYGDALPSTDMGKLVCGISMVCGILVIALPVTMIGNQFADAYADLSNEIL